MSIPRANVASSEFKAVAYDFYARLRAEAPVHPVGLAGGQTAWLISRYDDVFRALKDERLVKDRRNAMRPAPADDQAPLQPFSSTRLPDAGESLEYAPSAAGRLSIHDLQCHCNADRS